uniref:HDC15191 n=1 Tax=Drosophila melanogaster TaxID=7227 RepID=Q6IJC8_DROME|nr:TPA_inf: HDC15191 [Drosophila melanogaster]
MANMVAAANVALMLLMPLLLQQAAGSAALLLLMCSICRWLPHSAAQAVSFVATGKMSTTGEQQTTG